MTGTEVAWPGGAFASFLRALQWFLSNGKWDHEWLRDMAQRHGSAAGGHAPLPGTWDVAAGAVRGDRRD